MSAPVPPRPASWTRPLVLLLAVVLGVVALWAAFGRAAQTATSEDGTNRAAGALLEPFERASASLAGSAPRRFVQTVRGSSALSGGTARSLTSTATDLEARAVRSRSCSDGRLTAEFIYRDGELDGFLVFGGSIERIDGSSPGFDAAVAAFEASFELFESSAAAPAAFGFVPEATRRVGPVDFGFVAGEGVLFRYPDGNPFALGEGTAVVSERGLLTAMTAPAGELGELLLRVDGYLALPTGLVPRGFTSYRLAEARAYADGGPPPTPIGTTRFGYRFPDAPFDATLFDADAVAADLRARLGGGAETAEARARLEELRSRLRAPDLGRDELDAVLSEIDALRARLGPEGDAAPLCPGPL